MEKNNRAQKDWPMSTMLWFAVVIWFSSSLLSQSAYLAIYGLPYDAVTMLKSLGPVYYVIIALELAMWIGLLTWGGRRFIRRREDPAKSAGPPAVGS